MKKTGYIPHVLRLGIFILALLDLASCTENPGSPVSGGSDVIVRTDIDNSPPHSSQNASRQNLPTIGLQVDSIMVTSAGFAASNFQIRSDTLDTDPQDNLFSQQIHPEQFLLYFDINGRQYIGEHTTSASIYRSARFDIHPIAGRADSLAASLGQAYLTLFGGTAVSIPGATIIVRGIVYQGGSQGQFTYATNITGSERVIFDNALNVPSDGAPIVMLVKFTTANAFSSGGILMDPRDGRNAPSIDANLRTALRGSIAGN